MLFFVERISTIVLVNVSILILLWMTWIGSAVSPVHCLHSLLRPLSNPYGLRSRDHNFQLPVCNNFSRKSFIIRNIFRFKQISTVCVCFPDCQFLFFYACSSVYFTFSTIAMPLFLTHDLHVGPTFLTCCSINTQYSIKLHFKGKAPYANSTLA